MTHDGMWFAHCLQEFGIKKTNQINKAAGRALAAVESKRIKKAFGLGQINNMDQFLEALDAARSVLIGDFMQFDFIAQPNDRLRIESRRCFAHEGMVKLGVADRYECGIFNRLEGWFDGLGLKWKVTPEIKGCMMYDEGRCYRDYAFEF
jgi:hypothetical protein